MPSIHVITARQARAARAVMGLSVRELAERVAISESSIRRIECEQDQTPTLDIRAKVQEFFEREGFKFLFEETQRGVCWPLVKNENR